ncbi:MAG: hypothetical protein U5N21_08435 [Rhodococcus sp. (in: high G+C Gram-positive bacteria)]|nr:hypothetical protein [Rhodococcus sp. (in: high G+C Gram-positive bacteria)]
MSAISSASSAGDSVTGAVAVCSTGSPTIRMGRIAMVDKDTGSGACGMTQWCGSGACGMTQWCGSGACGMTQKKVRCQSGHVLEHVEHATRRYLAGAVLEPSSMVE